MSKVKCDGWKVPRHSTAWGVRQVYIYGGAPDDAGEALDLCPYCFADLRSEQEVTFESEGRVYHRGQVSWRADFTASQRRAAELRERTRNYHFIREVQQAESELIAWERERLKRGIGEFLAKWLTSWEGAYTIKITDKSEPVCRTDEPWKCTEYVRLHYVVTMIQEEHDG